MSPDVSGIPRGAAGPLGSLGAASLAWLLRLRVFGATNYGNTPIVGSMTLSPDCLNPSSATTAPAT
jgi:hypothetical protein